MSKKQPAVNYRALKKALSRYHHFGFKNPTKNKDYKPQQKSAITRMYKKIGYMLNDDFSVDKKEVTFLRFPKKSKLPHVDGIRTSKGLFYKWPQAELKKSKKEKNKWLVVVSPKIMKGATLVQKRKDVFFPFPNSVITDINRIKFYVEKLKEKYKPHDIAWAVKDKRERTKYDTELFDLYFSNYFLHESDKEILNSDEYAEMDSVDRGDLWKRRSMRHKHEDMPDYYIGVFFVYYLN